MKLHLLGSAAGKPVPRPFCDCRGCRIAQEKGGKSLRTRTSLNIYLGDDGPATVRYKVDMGPDAADHAIRFGESLTRLQHLLVTHAHQDHIFSYWLSVRRSAVSGTAGMLPLHLWGNGRVISYLETDSGIDFEACKIVPHQIEPFNGFRAGELDVFPLAGMHPETDPSINFVVTAEGKTVLLAWDTGYWSEGTWGVRRDFASMRSLWSVP